VKTAYCVCACMFGTALIANAICGVPVSRLSLALAGMNLITLALHIWLPEREERDA
jgi:hypothetical protein